MTMHLKELGSQYRCQVKDLSSGEHVLACSTRKDTIRRERHFSTPTLSRPAVCSNRSIADSTAMTLCSYHEGERTELDQKINRYVSPIIEKLRDPNLTQDKANQIIADLDKVKKEMTPELGKKMRGCGCSILDPIEHPKLDRFYVNQITSAVLEKIAQGVDEITITLFASGYILHDYVRLQKLLNLDEVKRWEGVFHLQLVDPKYAITESSRSDFKVTKTKVNESLMQMSNGLIATGIVGGTVSGGTLLFSSPSKKGEETTLNTSAKIGLTGSSIALVAGLILRMYTQNEEPTPIEMRAQSEPVEFGTAQGAVRDFLKKMGSIHNCKPKFFSSNSSCIEAGKKADIMMGYDTEDSVDDLQELQKATLRTTGLSIVVAKLDTAPYVAIARGPMQPLEFNERSDLL